MRNPSLILAAACALLPGAAPGAAAQEALVLGGGGARGLAHVGVLLRLEELGYDPDLVVGSSMGAVIGAMYAAGYDPEEIRRRTLAIEWNALFEPTPLTIGPDRAVRLPLLRFDLDVGRLGVSRGLFGQWRVNRTLTNLLFDASARSGGDFDRLPRRFRAVATDLETGELVVLGSGNLARAVAASMAFPGFFSPVALDGRVLVDGGVADNVPTAVARRLGAVRVIAVDVARPSDEITSTAPLAVLQRSLDVKDLTVRRDPLAPDVLVLPVIQASFSGPTFPDDPTDLIEAGLEAARRDLPPAAARTPREAPSRFRAPPSFAGLRVDTPDPALAAMGRRVFGTIAPGPYDPEAALAAVDRLFRTGLVGAVWPQVVGDTLVVVLEPEPPTSLSVGAGYENDRGGRIWATVDRHLGMGRVPAVLNASVSTDGIDRWAALAARAHPFRAPALAVSAGAHLRERDVRSFGDDSLSVRDVIRAGGWLGLELPPILRGYLATAMVRGEWIEMEGGPSGVAVGPLVRLTTTRTESLLLGIPPVLEGEVRWGSFSYARLAAGASRGVSAGPVRVAALADARVVSADAPDDVRPSLGDDHAVPGLRWGEGRGQGRVVLGLDAAVPFLAGFLRVRARTGAAPEELDGWDGGGWVAGGQLGVVVPSPFGLVEAGWGIATRGEGRFDVSLGMRF